MAIFHSYVKLPEATVYFNSCHALVDFQLTKMVSLTHSITIGTEAVPFRRRLQSQESVMSTAPLRPSWELKLAAGAGLLNQKTMCNDFLEMAKVDL